jgi:RNA polymerase sigma factor (sigma-70 family)
MTAEDDAKPFEADPGRIDAFRRGDAAEWKQLFAAYEHRVRHWLQLGFDYVIRGVTRRFAGHRTDAFAIAEDLNDTFATAWAYRDRFDPERASFAAWLRSIAGSVVLQRWRRARGEPVDAAEALDAEPPPELAPPSHRAEGIEATVEWQRVRACIALFCETLSDEERVVFETSLVPGDEVGRRRLAARAGWTPYRVEETRRQLWRRLLRRFFPEHQATAVPPWAGKEDRS